MPKAFLIAHIRGHDKKASEKFKALSGSAIADYGGKILVRKPSPDHRDSELQEQIIVVEFEDMDAARNFYESEAYAATRAVRKPESETDLMLVAEA